MMTRNTLEWTLPKVKVAGAPALLGTSTFAGFHQDMEAARHVTKFAPESAPWLDLCLIQSIQIRNLMHCRKRSDGEAVSIDERYSVPIECETVAC